MKRIQRAPMGVLAGAYRPVDAVEGHVDLRRNWRVDRGSAALRRKQAADRKEAVLHDLRFDAHTILSVEVDVLEVDLHVGSPCGALAIGCGQHDLSNQRLTTEATSNERACQPIEQLRVRRKSCARAEVFERAHQALAEQVVPDRVNGHARS